MLRTRFALVTAVALVAVALAGSAVAQEPAHDHAGHDHAIGIESIVVSDSLDPEAERAIKARGDMAHQTVLLDIDQRADALPVVETQRVPVEIMDAMLPVQMPVLMPAPLVDALDGAFLFGQADQYSLALDIEGATIVIEGSRRAFVYPHLEAGSMDAFKDDHGAIIGRTHGIVTAAFERYGLSYQIDVECARPMDDARCTEDAFVHSLIDSLAIAGGTF